jgi:hypothetical protein
VAGRDSGFCTEPHIACCAAIPVITRSHSEWLLAAPYSENEIQGTRLSTMEDIKSYATAELRKMLPIHGASVCTRKGPTLKVIR